MVKWTRRPQECAGDYFFNGRAHMTRGIAEEVPMEEVLSIIADLKAFVAEKNGIDYLQVFDSDDGRVIFCIDQLSRSMIESGDYTDDQIREHNHWIIMYAHEY